MINHSRIRRQKAAFILTISRSVVPPLSRFVSCQVQFYTIDEHKRQIVNK